MWISTDRTTTRVSSSTPGSSRCWTPTGISARHWTNTPLAFLKWREALNELEALSGSERTTAQEIDLLKHQVGEIEAAGLVAGTEEDLEARYRRASQGRRLTGICADIAARLGEGSTSVLRGLEDISRLLRDLEKLDPEAAEMAGRFRSAQVELQELETSLGDYAGDLDLDPEVFAELEDQVNALETLKRKYGNTIAEILEFGTQAGERLALIEGRGEHLERLRGEIESAEAALRKSGAALGKKRRTAAPKLAREIADHLGDLGFRQSRFEIEFLEAAEPGPAGLEHAEFLFSPNEGEPLKPLRVIASSGEMSRVMLAVKSALADEDAIPLLVFDEIDANVGGEIAGAVGAKMGDLGKSHQVISITHLPQVAAMAHRHYFVHKEVSNGRTRSLMEEVSGGRRVEEIARMLGGVSDSANAHAESLLASGTGATSS